MRISFPLILILLLAQIACTPLPRYPQPTDPSAPSLTLKNESGYEVAIQAYADPFECKEQMTVSNEHPRYMDISNKPGKIRLKPEEPFTFLVSMRVFGNDCFLVGTLVPKPSTDYVGSIKLQRGVCSVTVNALQDNVEIPAKTFIPRRFRLSGWGNSSNCADKLVIQ